MVTFTFSEVKTPAILAVYEKFKVILKSIIMYSTLLCLPVEIVAAPKGASQTKLQSDDARTKRPAKNC